MTEMELYKLWCEKAVEDEDLVKELKAIEGDEEAIKDRFYRDLEFGTGGLRGVIGAGTNRMNIYTVRRATQGFADYLNQLLDEKGLKKSEVIRAAGINGTYGYDCFSGKAANPSRDHAITLALGLRCTLLETQRLLRTAGVSELWAKVPRDAVIIYGVQHGFTRVQVDDDLYRLGFDTLVKES